MMAGRNGKVYASHAGGFLKIPRNRNSAVVSFTSPVSFAPKRKPHFREIALAYGNRGMTGSKVSAVVGPV
jgi:hypothetical protein